MEQGYIGNASTILLSLKAPASFLRTHSSLLNLAIKLSQELNLNIQGWHNCVYERGKEAPGFTIILYLLESHLLIETYPEYNLLELEIATCRRINSDEVKSALDRLNCSDNIICIKEIQKYKDKWY